MQERYQQKQQQLKSLSDVQSPQILLQSTLDRNTDTNVDSVEENTTYRDQQTNSDSILDADYTSTNSDKMTQLKELIEMKK